MDENHVDAFHIIQERINKETTIQGEAECKTGHQHRANANVWP